MIILIKYFQQRSLFLFHNRVICSQPNRKRGDQFERSGRRSGGLERGHRIIGKTVSAGEVFLPGFLTRVHGKSLNLWGEYRCLTRTIGSRRWPGQVRRPGRERGAAAFRTFRQGRSHKKDQYLATGARFSVIRKGEALRASMMGDAYRR